MRNTYSLLLLALAGLTGCSDESGQDTQARQNQLGQTQMARVQDATQIQRGQHLFAQNCAVCHGAVGQGAPNWSRPGASGASAAPPLNGTGHAWHHPRQALVATIKYGTIRLGGSMPAWQGKLSDQEIHDIMAWFQSQWPDEIYTAWQRMDSSAKLKQQ